MYIKPAIHFKWIEWNRLYQSFWVAYNYDQEIPTIANEDQEILAVAKKDQEIPTTGNQDQEILAIAN